MPSMRPIDHAARLLIYRGPGKRFRLANRTTSKLVRVDLESCKIDFVLGLKR